MKDKGDLLGAIWKKALGYSTTESVEEFTEADGQMVLSKQKVVTKDIAPDMTAAKLLMEQADGELDRMTDAELAAEKKRLLRLLLDSETNKIWAADEKTDNAE